jgi:DNA-binding LacI/PurR family transcriptional regulator
VAGIGGDGLSDHGARDGLCPLAGVSHVRLNTAIPALTTVAFDRNAIAEVALSAIYKELGIPDEPGPAAHDIATLIVREST